MTTRASSFACALDARGAPVAPVPRALSVSAVTTAGWMRDPHVVTLRGPGGRGHRVGDAGHTMVSGTPDVGVAICAIGPRTPLATPRRLDHHSCMRRGRAPPIGRPEALQTRGATPGPNSAERYAPDAAVALQSSAPLRSSIATRFGSTPRCLFPRSRRAHGGSSRPATAVGGLSVLLVVYAFVQSRKMWGSLRR
jgi:hypothetical protein